MSSSSTLSTVLPPITVCAPQELLPILPPSVQHRWVAGSGAKVRPCFFAASRSWSLIKPGSTLASVCGPGSSARISRFMYFEKSITTATLHGLAGEAGAAAAREDRHVARHGRLPRWRSRRRAARDHDADRHLAIDRVIGGIGAREPPSNRTSPAIGRRAAAKFAGGFAIILARRGKRMSPPSVPVARARRDRPSQDSSPGSSLGLSGRFRWFPACVR